MLLHYSRTVLAAIIWTILLNSSAKEIISHETSIGRFGKNVIDVHPEKLNDRTKDGGKMIDEDEKEGSNDGKKWFKDGKNVPTVIRNGKIDYEATKVFEKRHVRGNTLSHKIASARILTENTIRNNAWLETKDAKKETNDDPSIFQYHTETSQDPVSFKGNVVVAPGIAEGTILLKTGGSNVSTAIMTKQAKRKNDDNVARNGSTRKNIVDTEEASKLTRRFETPSSPSLIIHSKASKVKRQIRNFSLRISSDKHDYSTSGIVPKTRRKNDDSQLMESASLNDNSSGKDQHIDKAIKSSNDDGGSNKTGIILMEDEREKFFYAIGLKMENGNYAHDEKRMKKTLSGSNLGSVVETSMIEKKEHLENIPVKIQGKSATDHGSDANEIVKEEKIDKMRLSSQRDDAPRSKERNNIKAKNKETMEDSTAMEETFPQKNEDSGVSTVSMLSLSLEKKSNPFTTLSSIVYPSVLSTTPNKISVEISKEFPGQILEPRQTPVSNSHAKVSSKKEHLRNPRSSSPETENSDNHQQEQKSGLEKISYPGQERDKGKSYSASSLNNEGREKSTEKSRFFAENKTKKNVISRGQNSAYMRSNDKNTELTTSTYNKTSLSEWKFVDNSTSVDSTSRMLESLKIDSEGHKTFIGEKLEGGIDLWSDQKYQEKREGKKQVEKLSSYMGHANIDEIHGRKDEASWREGPLANSEASTSLWLGIKREKNVSVSIVNVTTEDMRKMEFSESNGTQESRRIKNGIGDDGGSGVERVIFSKESTKVIPRSMQFSESTTTESNALGDDGIIVENRENFIQTIYQTSRTDAPSSMNLPHAGVHPGDFDAGNDDNQYETVEYEEDDNHTDNGNGETSKVLGILGSELQKDKVFYQRRERDSQREISLDIPEKFRVQNLPLAKLISDASATTEIDRSAINTVDSRTENQKGESVSQKDTVLDVSHKNAEAISSSRQHVTILSNARIDEITPVTGYETLVETTKKERYDDRRANDAMRGNYIWTSKIDETDEAQTGNRLKLHEPNGSTEKMSPEIQRDTKNHIKNKISNFEHCQACKIVKTVVSNVKNGKMGNSVVGDDERRDNRVNIEDGTKKIGQSVIQARETLESTFHTEITRKNRISVDPEFIGDIRHSLGNNEASLKTIDRTKPEELMDERIQWKSTGMLARGQEPIINTVEKKSLIVSGKRVSALRRPPLNISKSSDSIETPATLNRRNERVKGLSMPRLENESRELNFPTPSRESIEKKDENIVYFTKANAEGQIIEFFDKADDVPRDIKNFQADANSQAISASDSGRRWKTLFHDDETTSLIKIDSTTGSIDRPSQGDGFSRRKELVEDSESYIRHDGTSGDALNLSNTRTKQIKRGFTSENNVSFSIVETTPSHSHVYGSTASTDTPEVDAVNSSETMTNGTNTFKTSGGTSSPVKIIKSSKSNKIITNGTSSISIANLTNATSSSTTEVLTEDPIFINRFNSTTAYNSPNESHETNKIRQIINERPSLSIVDPTNVNSPINDTGNYNLAHENTIHERDSNSTDKSSREFERIELTVNKQEPREMVDNVRGSYDTRTLNQTMKDNLTRTTATLNQWPVKHSAVVEGDLVLGGLMMVHEREDSVTCGPVMPQGGVQALEAMLYTLDWLNEHNLVPGVKIGAHILDDCDKDTYGLEMAVDFIKGSISNIDGAEYHCNKTAVRKVISGVVGAASSVTSIQVANLLRLFRIPQVSFFSTSPELSNKMRFEYFTRTIPSDHYQVKAMVDIVLVMGWSYVSIIYEESNYGEKAFEELEKLLGKHQICIAVKEKLSKDSGVAEAHVYDNIVLKLLTKPRARGCIIFGSDQEVAGVMRAVRRCNATGAFSWIGSDGWSARSLVSDGNEPEMEGTLSVQPQANPVEGFEDYFLNLTVENNRRNPWFVEFWEDHFKCRYPNASQTPYNNYTDECTTTERLTKQNTAFEDQLQFVSDAVLAFAYAFRNMHNDFCHGKPGLCDAMKPTKGTELLNYLRHVKFDGLSGDVFRFDKNGDGPARYNIIHFKQISPGKYKWIRVGEYLEGELRLNMSEIQFRLGHPQAPESVCSLPCEVGQAKKYVEGESCCWHCFNCTQYQIRHVNDETQCVLCPQGTVPDETHSYCRDIPEEFLRPESGWAIGAMSFSSTGILITLFVGGVFLKHNDTPIVRASGRELSYVLLTGILLCYLVTFALVLRPTDLVCSIQRFSAGFCFTVVYAALLTKTNRISRIFNAGKRSAKRPSFISPRSQLIICSMLVAIQILINAVWIVIDPAKARHHYPTREDNLLVCNSYIDASYMIAFTYPIILIVVCTVYAVLTRKIPEAFNESKHIGFTMYTTCVIWLAFVPLYFATGSHVALRITSMSVTISLSASVTIACLFTPKLYIILIHPERNVRPNMMHYRYNTTKASVITATNASSMMAPVTLTAVTCDQNKAVKKHVITKIDCSTQSEQFEMELKDRKNGKVPASLITRSTQTLLNNNGKDSSTLTSPVIKDIGIDDNNASIKILNIGKIGNGPLSQNEVPL